jgi:prepilin-type N-terminal cleavage/methylation domain-containing protein
MVDARPLHHDPANDGTKIEAEVPQEKRKMNRKGVTLIELIVVVCIVGITAALTVPGMGRQVQKYRLKSGAREVANFILETRTEAIKKGDVENPVAYRVVFNTSGNSFKRQVYQSGSWSDEIAYRSLPAKITIGGLSPSPSGVSSTDSSFRYFRPDGSFVLDMNTDPTDDQYDSTPVTVKIQLRNGRGDRYQVSLYSLSGMTEISEGWN